MCVCVLILAGRRRGSGVPRKRADRSGEERRLAAAVRRPDDQGLDDAEGQADAGVARSGRRLNPHPCDYMLVYEKPLENFVLVARLQDQPKCNSGIFVRTFPLTPRPGKDVGFNGIEIAIDDTRGAGYHDTGAIYDLVKPPRNAMKPVGEWNHIEITCDRPDRGRAQRRGVVADGPRRMDRAEHAARRLGRTSSTSPTRTIRAGATSAFRTTAADCWYQNIKIKPRGEKGSKADGS